MIGPCFAMHYLVAFHFCNHLAEIYFKHLLASSVDCLWCYVSLPHGVVGWAAVCSCGFPGHTYIFLR